ncbi:signal peptidase II [Georgenia sp. H159]|uniref:signal peptidase II n=1 Tax=Georgenia sp. H159 TaxID=3076115 RepID=UPI002D7823E1|nr:signal peptidase II [Georgenia sp. H159]
MTQQRSRRGRVILLVALAAVVGVGDQVTKYLAEDRLTPGVIVPVLGDVLGWQLIYNPGAAFSFATGMTWVFTVISLAVVVVVLRVSRRLRSTGWAVALGLLLGGALGNLYDRLLREPGFARGHVVDFINYNGWFVGNVADIAIVVAAVLIALLALLGIEVDGTRLAKGGDAEPVPAESDEDVSEEPLVDDEDFTPEVPRAADEDVDIASWAAGAPSVSEGRARRPGRTGTEGESDAQGFTAGAATWRPVRPAETEAPSATPEPGTGAAGEPAEEPGPTGSPRRPRSRRETRLSAHDDG